MRSRRVWLWLLVLALVPVVALAASRRGGASRGWPSYQDGAPDTTFAPAGPRGFAGSPATRQSAPAGAAGATEGTESAPAGAAGATEGTESAPAGPAAAAVPETAPAETAAAPTSASTAPSNAAVTGWESYRILSERNMFVRNRVRPQRDRGAMRVAPPDNPDERLMLTGIIQQGGEYVAFFEDTRTRKTTTVQAGASVGRGRLTAIVLDAVQYTCDGAATKVLVGSSLTGRPAMLRAPTPAPTSPGVAPSTPGAATYAAPASGTTTPTGTGGTPPTVSTAADAAAPSTAPVPENATTPETASTAMPPTAPPPAAAGSPNDSQNSGAASILERMRQRREQELQK